VKLTSKGQVTIPLEIRQKLGLFANTEVEFVIDGNTVLLRKAENGASRGKALVDSLRGRATVRMSTDEIMALTRGEE
jgi:AbrB family looped-hinge helix DNA binding protein